MARKKMRFAKRNGSELTYLLSERMGVKQSEIIEKISAKAERFLNGLYVTRGTATVRTADPLVKELVAAGYITLADDVDYEYSRATVVHHR